MQNLIFILKIYSNTVYKKPKESKNNTYQLGKS